LQNEPVERKGRCHNDPVYACGKALTSLQCLNTDLTRIYDDGVIPTAAVLPAEGGIL
jgi:hypothetical protein